MEQILQEVKTSLTTLVNSNYFTNVAENEKQDFVNRNLALFELEFPSYILSQIPAEIAKDPVKLEAYMATVNLEELTKNFIEVYKNMVR